jgi:hypothetical protein
MHRLILKAIGACTTVTFLLMISASANPQASHQSLAQARKQQAQHAAQNNAKKAAQLQQQQAKKQAADKKR